MFARELGLRLSVVVLLGVGCAPNKGAVAPAAQDASPPSTEPPAEATTEEEVESFSLPFEWRPGSVVSVRESVETKDKRIQSEFDLHVCETTGGLRLDVEDFRVDGSQEIEVSGMPVAAIRNAPVGLFLPPLFVSTDGVLDVAQVSSPSLETAERRLATVRIAEDTCADWDKPVGVELARKSLSEVWWNWVQAWQAFHPGGPQRQTFFMLFDNGERGDDYVVSRVGPHRRPLHLRLDRVIGHQEATENTREYMEQWLAEQQYGDAVRKHLQDARLSVTVRWEISLDPFTSRPLWSFREETTTTDMRDGTLPKSTTRRHSYEFTWKAPNEQRANCSDEEDPPPSN